MVKTNVETAEDIRQLVLFSVGDLTCGLNIDLVQEITTTQRTTKAYRVEEYVRGLVNLRGQLLTILDLHCRLGLESANSRENLHTLVVEANDEVIGLLVSRVEDVVTAKAEDFEPPPSNISGVEGAYFESVYKHKDLLVAVLNLEAILQVATTKTV